MVGRFLRYLEREVGGLHEAAYLLAFFTFLSQIVGLVRDRLFAHEFGAGAVLDVYYAAFRIPDILFVSIASMVSISVLVPLLIEAEKEGSKKHQRQFVDSIFTFFGIMIVSISVLVFFCVPAIVMFLFKPLVDAGHGPLLITMTRIMLLSPILLGASNFFASIMQVEKRFVAYALSPIFYNAGIVIGAYIFYPAWGVKGLAYGVVLGSFMHMVLQVPYLIRHRVVPRIGSIVWPIVRKVFSLSIYRTVALSSTHIAFIALTALASAFAVGSIAVFNFAWNLQSVPLAIVGVSYSMALFPSIARLYASSDTAGFVRAVVTASRHIIFWSLPVMVLFIVLRAQIVRTILGSGAFSWSDTRLTAAALAIFTVSILAQSLSLVFVRSYYASGNTKTPLLINLVTSGCIIACAFFFAFLINTVPVIRYFLEALLRVSDLPGTAVLVLPLGYTIAFLINLFLFAWFFQRDFGGFIKPVVATFFHSFSSSVIGGFVTYVMLNISSFVFDLSTGPGIFFQGLLSGLVGIIAMVIVLFALKSTELSEVARAIHHKIWRRELSVAEQDPL